ncbi:T9SS type A sorting domain-containing protein [Lutibacter sp. A64]|uniref:T9SS type A sorting domain-containing protein n=1 Tax=Lutibacter sp. A64 TaxID=2918526 RepID=UPI001F06C6F5|nr:T9SS type A sorting domain-containing protein [Lutibacter sp. A64]UMB52852.1 T9SS type A sorting domain-containing protein [Lutibacter sp. A64]
MKYFYTLVTFLLVATSSFAKNEKTVYISEINYTGSNPFIELAVYRENGNGNIQLKNWTLVLYNSNGNTVEQIDLQGKLKEGEFLVIDGIDFDFTGGAVILKNGNNIIESLSYGSSNNFNKYYNIGSTSGEISLQKTETGWIPSKPTPKAPYSSKSLSVVKDQIEDFNIYPNPVKDGRISISTKNSLDKNVVIYSILGSVVYNKAVKTNETINVENLSTGLYLVQVEEDKKVSVRKVLIN